MGSESKYYGMFKTGNTKLSKSILVFNMTSSKDCPSRKMGLCKACSICYARKSEMQYPNVLTFREKQNKYWNETHWFKIWKDADAIRRKTNFKFFRFNEAGDFQNQMDVWKLDILAMGWKKLGIITYGYTARSDLDFSNVSFIVRGSGWMGPNGQTNVIHKRMIQGRKQINGFKICPMKGCGTACTLCMKESGNILFPKH